MNAKDARHKVEQALRVEAQEQMVNVYKAIDQAVKDKKFEISWSEELHPSVKAKLIDDEYTIGANLYFRDEYSVTIKW